MKKYINIIGAIFIVIGIIMMYSGYHMAQGKFWGTAYLPGDYTTFIIGIIWIALGIITIVAKFFHDKKTQNAENESLSETKINKQSLSGCVPEIIRLIAIIIGLVGVLLIILGFTHAGFYTFQGIGAIFGAIILYGLSYIIHAAIIYINKQKE